MVVLHEIAIRLNFILLGSTWGVGCLLDCFLTLRDDTTETREVDLWLERMKKSGQLIFCQTDDG